MARKRLAGDQRREKILEAAIQVFGRKGFAGTTTRELARAARVSEATIFRFFPDKAALYRAIIGRFIETAGDPFPHAAATDGDDRAVLAGLAENLIRSIEEEPGFLRLLLFSALEEHALARLFLEARVLKVTRTLARYLKARMEAGSMRPAPPLLVARTYLGTACHYAMINNLHGAAAPARVPRRAAARLFASLFLEGMRSTAHHTRHAPLQPRQAALLRRVGP